LFSHRAAPFGSARDRLGSGQAQRIRVKGHKGIRVSGRRISGNQDIREWGIMRDKAFCRKNPRRRK